MTEADWQYLVGGDDPVVQTFIARSPKSRLLADTKDLTTIEGIGIRGEK
jgi:hypothetical protein